MRRSRNSAECEIVTNVDDSLDGAYLEWLYSHVGIVQNRNPERSYWKLLRQLYTTPFEWFIPNDDNRIEDGKALRISFIRETDFPLNDPHGLFYNIDCSILEMLIALAQQAAFLSEGEPAEWFWRMMHNLGFDGYTDNIFERRISEEVEGITNRLNDRDYSNNGAGGLFPLKYTDMDQRVVELWYQLQAYVSEGLYVNDIPRF